VTNLMMRRAVQSLRDHDLAWIEGDLIRQCVDMLHAYRKHCSSTASAGQLVLPESLKLLPLIMASVLKLDAFSINKKPNLGRTNVFDHVDIRVDARVTSFNRLLTLPVHSTLLTIYPRLFSIHDMSEEHGKPSYQHEPAAGGPGRSTTPDVSGAVRSLSRAQAGSRNGRGSRLSFLSHRSRSRASVSVTPAEYLVIPVHLPPLRWPSVDHLCSDGVFILEGDGAMFLRIGESPPRQQLYDMFGVADVAKLPASPVLPRLDNDFSSRLWGIIDYLQSLHEVHRPLFVVTPYSPEAVKTRFANMLTEDTNRGGKSYVDFLCAVHTQIQTKLTE